ncbi:MAG TPA: hypothetical protein VFQ73_02265 [Flavisolibacter sp.]|nr:hypothetical protein [Flavisolibacter sp.]
MLEDYQEKQRKKTIRLRSTMDMVMGGLIIFIGIYFLTYEKLGINVFRREPSSIDYFIGGLFILYGIWRVYRGYKKDYYR